MAAEEERDTAAAGAQDTARAPHTAPGTAPGTGDAAGSDGAPPGPGPRTGLAERERSVLAFERRSWPGPGAKERAIREDLGMTPVRYYQLLNALLDDPYAERHDPVTVHRLQRVRAEHRARREPAGPDAG
ncbi:DUF3263 domain-containing protein [Streptomyces sp. NPDC050560]|uniref:DUF3263 domain-containing protein n=1 Tax=Streptomyces sp. NPDC050560 TaxID=3365630 RepID=UPI0037BB5AC0